MKIKISCEDPEGVVKSVGWVTVDKMPTRCPICDGKLVILAVDHDKKCPVNVYQGYACNCGE